MTKNKFEKEPKSNSFTKQNEILESQINQLILSTLFGFVKNIQLEFPSRKLKLKQNFLARASSIKSRLEIRNMFLISARLRSRESVRIDLKTVESINELLQEISKFIPLDENSPLSKKIKPVKKSFSRNNVAKHLKQNEKIHKAISIPINDLIVFYNQTKNINIPLFANKEVKVFIVATTLNNSPTSLIFVIMGRTKKISNTHKFKIPRILKPGLV